MEERNANVALRMYDQVENISHAVFNECLNV